MDAQPAYDSARVAQNHDAAYMYISVGKLKAQKPKKVGWCFSVGKIIASLN